MNKTVIKLYHFSTAPFFNFLYRHNLKVILHKYFLSDVNFVWANEMIVIYLHKILKSANEATKGVSGPRCIRYIYTVDIGAHSNYQVLVRSTTEREWCSFRTVVILVLSSSWSNLVSYIFVPFPSITRLLRSNQHMSDWFDVAHWFESIYFTFTCLYLLSCLDL